LSHFEIPWTSIDGPLLAAVRMAPKSGMLWILLPFKAASNVSISLLAISLLGESVIVLEVMRSDFTFRYTRACGHFVSALFATNGKMIGLVLG